ncbi:uncharacterized protein LOC127416906 [Myxocyprinus asiaticus]|uniref:uncharacterized protein LOC127416906 n=1 Tax=Myxocyprinus asiaticus TaxID=70543 RepID=UPI0022235387|nr:uncharacterized protein LOC127416906 [Myxocyprinus asiaticus]
MMSSTLVLNLLLLVSIASAGHYYGGSLSFSPKGINPDGSIRVDFRIKQTYDETLCYYEPYNCVSGNCGYVSRQNYATIDRSSNGRSGYTNTWCQNEAVVTRNIYGNMPFDLQDYSCCWVPTVNGVGSWRLWTHVDLGLRSDTNKPNHSPLNTILPLLRVPQNCPRTYRLMAFDPDGDKVRCRYGIQQNNECDTCNQPSGFQLDRNACTLDYSYTYNTGVYGFELVLEDFPRQHINLSYTDGTQSYRCPLGGGRHKRAPMSWWYTSPQTTTQSSTTTPGWLVQTTTLPPTTTPWWWWWYHQQTTTLPPTTTTTTTTTPWWWYHQQTTTLPPTTTPWWWWYHQQTTTLPPTTTTTPWWWYHQQTTTLPPTTTPWWWWYHQQTTTLPPTTTPWWLWLQTTPATTTYPNQQFTTTTIPPHQRSYDPLSKIPLQFSLLVDPPAPSCTEGLYIPHFVSPTPHNGEQIHATPLNELEIRVKATAAYSTVSDVIISGPQNITKHPLSTGEYAIRWTPMMEDVGDYFSVCFIAESSTGNSIYQSEMRCVIVTVGRQTVDANVICTGTNMVIEIEQVNSVRLHKDYLRLNNPSCTLDSNGTHVLANISLNACGTMIEEDDLYIIFKNAIISMDDPNSIITRKHEVEIEFSCRYEKSNNVSLQFTAQRHMTTITEKGFGTLTYRFGLYETADYTLKMDPNTYPVEYELGQMIYMEIESQSSINNTELFVDSCIATPFNDPNYQTPYSIIQNGCIVDDTVQFYTSHKPMVRFAMEAFKFIGLHDQVFISCSVILCEANNPKTRCSQGCINSTVAPPSHHHRKREAPIQTSSHFVSQGPLRLKRSVEREASSTALNLNLVFIAGCLLAVVGMVCAVLIYRTRKPEVKYQPLKTAEI